jgi:hypothetical protein
MNLKDVTLTQYSEEELRAELERRGNKVEVQAVPQWPLKYELYVHASDEHVCSSDFNKLCKQAGWKSDGTQASVASAMGYEHKLTYEVNKDGSFELVAVDDRAVAR